ncbi:outer membrane beta-barrel protein [Sphingomonas sp. 3-13AW]|uniref:outer membrane beta-barrel protein n=1 Tax=Sphingomonas sp. 3-13AW TaxID=3050450 RepID=UPI003BB69ACB
MGVMGLAVLAAGTITTLAAPVSFDDLAEDVANRARLGMEARVLYDDNILRLDKGRPVPPDRSKDDVRTTVSAVVDVAQRVSRQRVFLRGAAGYDFYRNNRFLKRERIEATAGVDWRIGRPCQGEASVGYGRGQSDLADLGGPVRNTRDSRTIILEGGCALGTGLRPEFGFRGRTIDNSAASRLRSDLEAERFAAGIAYNRGGPLSFGLAAATETLDFPNRRLADGQADSTRVRSVTARITARGANLIASGSLAFVEADSRNPGARDFSGPAGGASLSWAPGGRLRLSASARREVNGSGDIAAGYFLADRGELLARYRIGRAVDVEVGGLLQRRRFRAVDLTSPGARSFDRTVEARAALGWSPVERVRIGLEATHARRTTDATYGTYRSSRGLLVLGLAL